LTDAYWIHGGSIKDVFTTIKYGVLDKGMISWQETLSPVQMQNVASYLLTFQGTKPANPKAPQGTLYDAAASAEASSADTSAAQP
jgi:cytochrome c oxidase cbb3-type subunit 3